MIGLIGMHPAECNHSFRAVMMFNTPGRIKMMPCQVRITAALHWTAKPYFLA